MRKLVKNEILTIRRIARAMPNRIPRANQCAQVSSAVAQPGRRTLLPQTATDVTLRGFRISARIYQNRMKVRVVVGLAMKKHQARLRCDRDPDLVSELQTSASLEVLLAKKDLHMLEKLSLVFRRKAAEDGEVVLDDCSPVRRKRL